LTNPSGYCVSPDIFRASLVLVAIMAATPTDLLASKAGHARKADVLDRCGGCILYCTVFVKVCKKSECHWDEMGYSKLATKWRVFPKKKRKREYGYATIQIRYASMQRIICAASDGALGMLPAIVMYM
jgi:hypothetical protein